MASNTPEQCCTTGTLHKGAPKGNSIMIEDKFEAYISTATPSNVLHKNCGILYLPDVLGIWQNSKLIADNFAAKGYTCMVLDIYNGDALKLNKMKNLDFPRWVKEGLDGSSPHTPDFVDPIVLAGIKKMKDLGFERIGAVGYCFGAKYVIRHYKSGIDCGYIAHPYDLKEVELSAISGPISIAAAEIDDAFTAEKRYATEKLLRESGQPFQINLFSGVEHGFATRGNPRVKAHRYARDQAFLQAVAWFDSFLGVTTAEVYM